MIAAIFFTWFGATTVWTINALRRPVPPGKSLPPLWLPGMIVSELAPWLLVERFLIAALLIWAGALERGIGQVGLVLFILSQVGILILIQRSFESVRRAGKSAKLSNLWKVRVTPPESISIEHEVPYWDKFTAEVYRSTTNSASPALIYLHPGSWMRGRPGRQALGTLYNLAAAGWVVLDLRYPLSPAATFPDHLIGVKRAIAWAKDPSNGLGIDPGRVAIAGGSSGAHLAALAALTWDDTKLQPGFESADTSVMACAPHYGIYDLLVRNGTRYDWPFIAKVVMKTTATASPDLYRIGSPIDLVRRDAPPFFVVHGEFDSVVLAAESQHFVAALEAVGAPVQYHEVRAAQHGYDAIRSIRTRAVGTLVEEFLTGTAANIEAARDPGRAGT
jgi:acetyl esterase/lipase